MAVTYNAALATTRDWVRFLVYDRDTAKAVLQDEEIDAVLVEESDNKYLAAARVGEILLLKHGFKEEIEAGDGDARIRWSRTRTEEFRSLLRSYEAKGRGSACAFRVL